MFEYTGAIHIHSKYSDGTGTIEDIAKAAYNSGLDFIIMTDHNTIKPKEDGYERWINDVLVIIGYELNDMTNKNHLIALGLDELIGSYEKLENGELGCRLEAKDYVQLVKEKGGISLIAHPDEERTENGHIAYPWTEWDVNDFTGIEIWNHMSEWVEGMKNNNKINRVLHPLKTITAPSKKTIKRWDMLAMERQITPIGSVDAHAFKQNVMGLFDIEIFPYKVLFKSIRTNVLLKNAINKKNHSKYTEDKKQILNALRSGKCYINNSFYGSSKGFRFFAEYRNKIYNMGDEINIAANDKIFLETFVPKNCLIKLIHNGSKVNEVSGLSGSWEIKEPGVYRIECWLNKKGWIFSNHIRVVKN